MSLIAIVESAFYNAVIVMLSVTLSSKACWDLSRSD